MESLPRSHQESPLLLLLLSRFSRVRLCVTPEAAAHQAPRPWDSPGKNTGVGCHLCSTLKILLHCLLASIASDENSVVVFFRFKLPTVPLAPPAPPLA